MAKEVNQNNGVKRGLKDRHISMIAIGGCIGTGLFMTSGGAIHDAGALGALLAYAIIGAMVFFLMTSLGEMATYLPVSGSFSTYATRFVDPSLGFALGWNYWFNWVITVAADVTIAAQVIQYWTPLSGIPAWSWSCLFLIIIFGLNALSVRVYGESEYWFALIKVVTVIIFIAIGLLTILGIMGGEFVGFDTFSKGGGPILGDGLGGSLLTILGVFLVAGFSFQGTELIGITAGESENPERAVPKAIKQVFWRILLFYVLSIAVISAIIPYTDPLLLNKSESVSQSPFTIVFDRVGIAFAASVINAVILTSLLSAANSGIYTTSRMLFSMAEDKQAPRFLSKLNKTTKLPLVSLFVTFMIVLLIIIIAQFKSDIVFSLLNIIGSLVIVVWASSIVAQIRLRSAIKKQNKNPDEVLPYKAPFYPLGPIIVIIALLFLFIGNSIGAILAGDISVLIRNLSPMIILAIIYFVHKLLRQTKIVKLEDIDLKEHDYN